MKNVYRKYFMVKKVVKVKSNVYIKIFFIMITKIFFVLQFYLFVQESFSSNTTANFLKIGIGARATGLAETFCAISDDVTSIYYNPAGLAQLDLYELSFGYNRYIENINYFTSGYNFPFIFKRQGKKSYDFNIGIGIYYLSMEEIKAYDSSGVSKGTVIANDMAISLVYSQRIARYKETIDMPDFKPGLYAGISAKLVNKKLAEITKSGITSDFGLLFIPKTKLFNGSIRTGVSVQNYFGGLQFDTEMSEFPLNTKFGIAYRKDIVGNPLTTGIDFNLNPNFISFGAEYFIMNILAIRAGYKFASELYLDQGPRIGFGIGINNFRFDYSFAPFVVFGETHKANITIKFGNVTSSKISVVSYLIDKSYKKSMLYISSGKYLHAYRELLYITELDPTHTEAKTEIKKIEELFKQVQQEKLKEKIDKEIKESFNQAKDLFDKGDILKAREIFDIIIKLNPEHKESKSYLQKIDNIHKEAIKQRITVYFTEGINFYEKGNYTKAIQRMENILEIDPNYEKAKEYLTLSKQKQNEMVAKQKETEKLKQAEKMYQEATAFFDRGNYSKSVELFKKLLELIPNYKDVSSKLSQAQQKYELQIVLNKEESAKLYTEGLKAYTSGDLKKAYELWKKSSELDPGNDRAKKGVERLEKEIKK